MGAGRGEKAREFAGAGRPGNSQNLGRTEDVENYGCSRFSKQGNVCKQQRRAESEWTSETMAYTESKPAGRLLVGEEKKKPRLIGGGENVGNAYGTRLQTERAKQQTTGTSGTGENVQHSDSAGCKEQYISAESNKEGVIGFRCNAGYVCDTTSKRLSDRTSEPVGGQRAQEQEPERPDSNVSDANDGSRDVRRDSKLSAAEEIERTGCNIGGRAKKHEPGEWRSAESVLGGVADGIPARMDGDLDFIINQYWDNEPGIPRVATGIEHRVDRLKCLGNAVVPQQFYPIFRAIAEIMQVIHKSGYI